MNIICINNCGIFWIFQGQTYNLDCIYYQTLPYLTKHEGIHFLVLKLMSFVMPKEFALQTTPRPTDPDVKVSELKNYKVAAITFSGTLSRSNVAKHRDILTDWINANGYTAISEPIEAGYNGPMTLPMLRRNEVLIEIK